VFFFRNKTISIRASLFALAEIPGGHSRLGKVHITSKPVFFAGLGGGCPRAENPTALRATLCSSYAMGKDIAAIILLNDNFVASGDGSFFLGCIRLTLRTLLSGRLTCKRILIPGGRRRDVRCPKERDCRRIAHQTLWNLSNRLSLTDLQIEGLLRFRPVSCRL
jgi:hypothetical protein